MNTRTRIATYGLAAMLLSTPAWAARYDYAKVQSVEPIVNYVTVSMPVRLARKAPTVSFAAPPGS